MLWIVDRVLSDGAYSIPVCIETELRLYVVLVGPPPADRGEGPPAANVVTVTKPDGGPVRALGYGGRGSREESILTAEFDRPPPNVEYLDVELRHKPMETPEAQEAPDVSARIRRLR